MKLSPRDAAKYLGSPDPERAGILIYGADPMRVALKRQTLIEAILGPKGDEEMRLSRISAAELRKDTALLQDALKAVGFFPGPRAAFLEEAADGLAPTVKSALDSWQKGDATIVVTANMLPARSALRKLFEGHANAYSLAVYNDPPSRAEISAELAKLGLPDTAGEGLDAVYALASQHDPGEMRQTLEKLALYKLDDDTAISAADVANCAPMTADAQTDEVIRAAAEGFHAKIGPLIGKLQAQGTQPVYLCITTLRHFRALHIAACAPGGASAGIAKLRPPVFGPRREQMMRQAQNWGVAKLEQAIDLLIEIDLGLRSSTLAPQMAMLERGLIRLAMMGRQR